MESTEISAPIEIPNFRILELLGHGGMGKVYLAEQQAPRRKVVIKIVDPDSIRVTDPEIKERVMAQLQREGDIAARFQHPNLVTVFECGVIDEHYYLAMEYLAGGDLRMRLKDTINESEAVEIAIQVAAGLGQMHRLGLLHRDLKPENILFRESGEPVLVDFGIAKDTKETTTLTALGVRSGTPHYMSPEHVGSEPMDGRSDLYALGVVLFEMLTGDVPFDGNTNLAIGRAHLEDPVPRLPKGLEVYQPVIDKLLAKNPADRYQDANELIQTLHRMAPTQPGIRWTNSLLGSIAARPQRNRRVGLLAAIGVVAAAALGFAIFLSIPSGPGPELATPEPDAVEPTPEKPTVPIPHNSIAVLPFVNMSSDPENEYFSDGISEEILNSLARLEPLRVAARSSSFQFKGMNMDVSDVGRALHVRHVLEGSVRKAGNRVRVTAQLIDTTTGFHLWSETYDSELGDIIAIQDEIGQAVTDALQLTLLGNTGSNGVTRATNVEAYDLYLLGRHHFHHRNQESLERARSLFEQAIALDPGFALAHVGLANATILLLDSTTTYGDLPLAEVNAVASQALGEALSLQPNLAEVHAGHGLWKIVNGDYESAVRYLTRAITLKPNYAMAYMWRGTTEGFLARFDRCLSDLEQAREIDPLSPAVLSNLIWANHLVGDPARTDAYIEEALSKHPDFILAWGNAGNVRYMQGRHDEAKVLYETAYEKSPSYRLATEMLGIIELDQGHVDAAARWLTGTEMPWPLVAQGRIEDAWEAVVHDYGGNYDAATYVAAVTGHPQFVIDLFDRVTSDPALGQGALMVGSDVSNLGRLPALTVAHVLKQNGDPERARQVLDAAAQIINNGWSVGTRTPGMHYARSVLLALQGYPEEAIAGLESAVDAGWRSWWYLGHDPRLESIRHHPRIETLLERITPEQIEASVLAASRSASNP